MFDLSGKKIWVAGHQGMVGSALIRRLGKDNCEILTVDRRMLDARRQQDVECWVDAHKPEVIIIAAATVGGIQANASRPAEFIYDNVAISANIIHAAYISKVSKLLFLGSSCIYPKMAEQPITEDTLLAGPLEETNQWYAVAKIAGIKLCAAYRKQYGCDFISAMPCNLYGTHDNFSRVDSHVIPALIRKIHEAKLYRQSEVHLWGTGSPRREFLHCDDLADGLVHFLKAYSSELHVNIGSGVEVSISELAVMIAEIVGFKGGVVFDHSKPDGAPHRMLDVSIMHSMGWTFRISLWEGLNTTYQWFLEHYDNISAQEG